MIVDDKVYGKQEIKDELIINLINSKEMQRLKGINQYGTWGLWNQKYNTTRFEHSLGVYFLLKRFKASYIEQIAGLLHDINHTAFSHVIDYVLGDPKIQEHGDKHHESILLNSSIPKLLEKYRIKVEQVLDKDAFSLLENPLPDLCCDRIDYCMRDSLIYGTATIEDVKIVLSSITAYNNEIIMKNRESAKKLANMYLSTSKEFWVNFIQTGIYRLAADAFKLGLRRRIITEQDFYLMDQQLLDKLLHSGDKEIIEKFKVITNQSIKIGTKEDHDLVAHGKARFIDPKFTEENEIKRLSDIDENFKKEIKNFKERINRGFYIKLIR